MEEEQWKGNPGEMTEEEKRKKIMRSPLIKVMISDGRSITVRCYVALQRSQLLQRMIAQEGEELDKQQRLIEETMARQHLGGVLAPDTMTNITLELKAQLESTKITEFAKGVLQTFFDTQRLCEKFDTVEQKLELLVALSYLEMEEQAQCYRNMLTQAINSAPSVDAARRALQINSSFVPPSDAAEQKFVSLFRQAWPQGEGSSHTAAASRQSMSPLSQPADAAAVGHAPVTPNVEAFQSSLGHVPADRVCPCNGNGLPPEIAARRHQMAQKPTNVCAKCGTPFTLFMRQHTCRSCGGKFCYGCLTHQVVLGFKPIQTAGSVMALYREGCWEGSMVCDECYDLVVSIGSKYSLWSQAMMAASFPLATACRAALLSKEWYDCGKDYVFRFRNMQHRLPTKRYTEEEKRVVWANRMQFSGHPLWTLQLLRVADWDSQSARQDVLSIIREKPLHIDCSTLLCSKACNGKGLRPIDCIVALNGHLFPLPHVIRCALVDILDKASTAELLHYVPHLVHYLRFDRFPFEAMPQILPQQQIGAAAAAADENMVVNDADCDNSPLTHLLFRRCLPRVWTDESRQFCFEVYWALSVEVSAGGVGSDSQLRDFAFMGLYNHLRNALVFELQKTPEGTQLMEAISSEYALVDMLKDEKKAEKEVPLLTARKRLFLPFDSSHVVVGVDMMNRVVKSSAKKPVIIPCTCVPTSDVLAERRNPSAAAAAPGTEGAKSSFMYKLDDLRNDQVVMKCVQIIKDVVFAEVPELRGLPCVSYHVQPITKCTGFIEIIAGKTLTDIQKRGTVSDWLLAHVKDGNGRDVFIQSAAVGTVLVYVLGIGDRHRENLMVTNKGEFINIDFGYLEGNDTMYSPYARIPADVICYENNKQVFLDWCKCIYLQLRRYAMHIHSLLLFLHTAEERADLKRCEEFIQDRFCVECDESEALKKLESFLDSSERSFMNTVRDASHQGKQYLVNAMETIWKLFHYDDPPVATASTASLSSTATGMQSQQQTTVFSGVAFPPVSSNDYEVLDDSLSVGQPSGMAATTAAAAAAPGMADLADTAAMEDTGIVFPTS